MIDAPTAASALTTTGLTRRFGDLTAVRPLDLDLPAGGIIGLVGPNGSGKSTLIRMLLGLVRPSAGTATVLGSPLEEPRRFLHRVGALIEGPAFVPALSGRANLLSLARLRGLPASRVDEVLDVVGLTGRDREPVKRFSLGMKQRLGIAAALLPDPELLILDEPTNGLDPSGIVEIRALLGRLGREGRTVIVSSHLLSEIEAVCDHLLVIRFGELLYTGPIDDLMRRAHATVEVRPEHDDDAPRLLTALTDAGFAVDGDLRVRAAAGDTAAINRTAIEAGITLRHLAAHTDSLEEVFLQMTGTDEDLAAERGATAGRAA
ncbi:MAG: ATP-binding cassette domain-containing protein [Solirubrobacteraceae bacterium]|nr:ATP-binding cassette domain-containing protein [Solirubrobacteraceae bacterium]